MGIYISGMELPKFGDCIVITSDGVASKYLAGDVAIYYDARPDKSSAIELPPHGRLIDANALIADTSFFDGGDWHYGYSAKQIENAPTIIPAEGGEDG